MPRLATNSGRIAIVVKGYPRLSETFIAQEIAGLEALGLDLVIVSLRRPTDRHRHPLHGVIRAPVMYLPEYLWREPARVARALRAVRRWPTWAAVFAQWRHDFNRDPTANRGRRLGQAAVLAFELGDDVRWLHAHFIHTPGSVTYYAAMLTGLPWSASAHARDIWTIPDWEKAEKLAAARWVVTCTAANAAHLDRFVPGKVDLIYHGLDLARFPPQETAAPAAADGADPARPVTILSVGRAVEKKGIDQLLAALARLPATTHWRLRHIGGGPLSERLRRLAKRLRIDGRVEWLGAQPQDAVLRALRAADLFVLASRVAADGDRDGLPNVLMEAQSQGLACIATRLSAIPELIDDGETGLLVPPDDVAALHGAIAGLIGDPARRQRLGAAGQAKVRARFRAEPGIARLAARLRGPIELAADQPPPLLAGMAASGAG
jgi:glycosyltransferase involved in cell wall biosynthesis